MGQLTNLYVSQSYQGLLKLTDSTTGVTSVTQSLQDGLGNNIPIQVSTTQVNISGSFFINNVPITNGTSGTSGTSGVNGSSGTSGQSGSSGSSGTSGSSGSSGSSGTGSSGTSGSSGVGTSGTSGSSGTSGQDGSSGSSGTSGTDGSSGTSGVGTSGTSGTSGLTDKTGLITTGSIVDTQQITGSLILGNTVISGSLIGNTVNGGIIKIQSEGNISGSVKFNITSSSPISQSNVIFGGTVGPSAANLTGSVTISGSNNILFNGFRTNTLLTQGTYGYLNGFSNIVSTIPTLGTGSVIRPTINNNQLNAGVSLQFTTSSLGIPNIGNNLIYSAVNLNHQSGSVTFNVNGTIGGALTSTQNITTPNTPASILGNLFTSNLTTTLSHNSSSILYQGNIGAVIVTNNYSSSISTAIDNITVSQNIFNGNSINLVVTGSNTNVRRTFNSNLISGRSNLINSDHFSSSLGHLVSTAILGEQLIVSASHTSTTVGGSVFVGRFNATGSLQESSQDAVFVVGTGTSAGNRRNAIHVDSNNNTRITGSLLVSGSATINSQQGLVIQSEADAGRINVHPFGDWLYRNTVTRNTIMGEVNGAKFVGGTPFLSGSQENLLFAGFYLAFNSGSQNTVIAGAGGNFLSGSQNTILGSVGNLQYGNGNLIIGNPRTSTLMEGVISIGTTGSPYLLYKSGSVVQMGYSTQITGSLDVSNGVTITGITNLSGQLFTNNDIFFSGSNYQTQGVIGIVNNQTLQIQNNGLGGYNQSGSAIQMTFTTGSGGVASFQMNASVSGSIADLTVNNTAGLTKVRGLATEFLFSKTEGFPNTAADKFEVVATNTAITGSVNITGSLRVTGDVQFSSGSNKTIGTAVLDGGNPGSVVVSNSLVTSNSIIFLTKQTLTNAHMVAVSSKGSGTFTITSNGNGDADTVAFQIINPA